MKELVLLDQIFVLLDIKNVFCINLGNGSKFYEHLYNKITEKNINFITSNFFEGNIEASQVQALFKNKKIRNNLIYCNNFFKDLEFVLEFLIDYNGIIIFENCKIPNIIFEKFELLYCENNFVIFQNKNIKGVKLISDDIKKRTNSIVSKLKYKKNNDKIIIGIGILTFNHEKYILDCLNSVFEQSGMFEFNVVIVDDHSKDNTVKIIKDYLKKEKKNFGNKFKIKLIENKINKGAINSLNIMLNEFKNTDYFTFCEGDDYWNSKNRILKFIDFMKQNDEVSLAFNSLYVLEEETNKISKYIIHQKLKKKYFLTGELISDIYFIGNLGCCFYDSYYLKFFDSKIFDMHLYDFFLNTYYSTFGMIGHLKDYLSTYRIHKGSFWSSLKVNEKANQLLQFINEYNKYFNFIYNYEYDIYQNSLFENLEKKSMKLDLLILDNIFPNELSPFSYEEITNYLLNIESSYALCSYKYTAALNQQSLRDGIEFYKKKHLEISNKLSKYTIKKLEKIKPKLVYLIFKSTVMDYYNVLKNNKYNFVFELYPGGGFVFNDEKCDNELKKIVSLKGFKKVIVTQKPVEDYLIKKKICKKSQIEMIFGVVMNNKNEKNYKKIFYGKDKKNLDIVFMAHKYHQYGKDKGYDLFIEVAKKLCKNYKNINFHVVGNFDEKVIDVSEIGNKITFYGKINKQSFDEFFKDKDIILSPNRPNVLNNGAFDGFPTASCTEAGLREVVMMCSDELSMHETFYKNNEDLIIIKNDENDIIEKIKYLYNNYTELIRIAENGRKRILKLYDFNSQMLPRINLINSILKKERINETKS